MSIIKIELQEDKIVTSIEVNNVDDVYLLVEAVARLSKDKPETVRTVEGSGEERNKLLRIIHAIGQRLNLSHHRISNQSQKMFGNLTNLPHSSIGMLSLRDLEILKNMLEFLESIGYYY